MVSTWLPLAKSEPMWSRASSRLVTHDLPVQKPCCLGEITWYRWSLMLFNTQRSKTLDAIRSREMGRYFSTWSFEKNTFLDTSLKASARSDWRIAVQSRFRSSNQSKCLNPWAFHSCSNHVTRNALAVQK